MGFLGRLRRKREAPFDREIPTDTDIIKRQDRAFAQFVAMLDRIEKKEDYRFKTMIKIVEPFLTAEAMSKLNGLVEEENKKEKKVSK